MALDPRVNRVGKTVVDPKTKKRKFVNLTPEEQARFDEFYKARDDNAEAYPSYGATQAKRHPGAE